MLKFLGEIDGIADIGRDAAGDTGLFQCLHGTLLIICHIRAVEVAALLHTLYLILVFIEVVDRSIAYRSVLLQLHR
jgi:hypothetical protein